MSQIHPVGGHQPQTSHTQHTQAPSAANPTTAAAVASTQEATSATKISNINDLREKAPKVYNQMLIGLATTVCNRMQHSQERVKKIMREAQKPQ